MSNLLHRCDRGALFAAVFGLAACGGSETDNDLFVSERDDGIEYQASWDYRSFKVDVDLTLTTFEQADTCSSTGSLVINDVVSEEASYRLAATDCSILRLNEGGDIVLREQSTGHDWTNEALHVDTEREIVLLGPVILSDPRTGETEAFRFSLAAPPCPDNPDCDCGALERSGGAEKLSLDLGRKCD